MLKQLFTLARGQTVDRTQSFLDANALTLLRQQMREAAESVSRARKAVAVAMAYEARERKALEALEAQLADLETRARAALEQGREDLAAEAASAIAGLEAERASLRKVVQTYAQDIAALRQALRQSEAQLAELKRGQRLAEATGKTQSMRAGAQVSARSPLADAASTLTRLQERQKLADTTLQAMSDLSSETSAEALSDRLAAAGMGAAKTTSAEDVLTRLKKDINSN